MNTWQTPANRYKTLCQIVLDAGQCISRDSMLFYHLNEAKNIANIDRIFEAKEEQ